MASAHAAIEVINPDGAGPFVVVCEHASNAIPAEFGTLGLDPALLDGHIAWDPGARGVAEEFARRVDAPLIMPRVSRLVCDCNRPHGSAESMPDSSEIYDIPGNRDLTPGQRHERARRFYAPFRASLESALRRRVDTGSLPVLVTIHSFTPVYKGKTRDVELGIVHDDDARLADAILSLAEDEAELAVGRNRPYGPEDGVTHTLRVHALPLGLLNVMIEVRNDLIRDAASQARMAERLARYLNQAVAALRPEARPASHA